MCLFRLLLQSHYCQRERDLEDNSSNNNNDIPWYSISNTKHFCRIRSFLFDQTVAYVVIVIVVVISHYYLMLMVVVLLSLLLLLLFLLL